MAARKIIWTKKANIERRTILNYWRNRNKSNVYSRKLNNLFISSLKQVANNPEIGRLTSFSNIRVKIVRSYLLFYEIHENYIKVLSLWDGRRDESTFSIK